MQMTRPNEIRSPGVRLHPKACAALRLEAARATTKHLGTPVLRTCIEAGPGYRGLRLRILMEVIFSWVLGFHLLVFQTP